MADAPPRAALDLKTRLAISLGWWVLRLLGRTWRVRVIGADGLARRAPGTAPVVYVLWHGQMLLALWKHAPRTGVLVSEHKDGEIITRILERFGMFGVRGSSSRGGTRALLEAVQVVRGGLDMAFTPDGPRGPRHSFAPGALILAHRAGVPLVSIVAHADRTWVFRSWDRFELPKPFARVTVLYDTPVQFDDADARAAAARAGEYTARLHAATARVTALAAER